MPPEINPPGRRVATERTLVAVSGLFMDERNVSLQVELCHGGVVALGALVLLLLLLGLGLCLPLLVDESHVSPQVILGGGGVVTEGTPGYVRRMPNSSSDKIKTF